MTRADEALATLESLEGIELILLKQIASSLVMPLLILGPEGELLFFNEPAEPITGSRFDETGALTADEFAEAFRPTAEDGTRMEGDQRPMIQALRDREPVHGRFQIRGFDGRWRHIEATAIPLVGKNDVMLGALAIFWELAPAPDPASGI